MSYDPSEQELLLDVFKAMFKAATADGGVKRAAGLKPPWWQDQEHEPAIYSHLNKWKHGERVDKDSGAHPLVHLAWRAVAIAYQETYGKVDPAPGYMRRLLGIESPPVLASDTTSSATDALALVSTLVEERDGWKAKHEALLYQYNACHAEKEAEHARLDAENRELRQRRTGG